MAIIKRKLIENRLNLKVKTPDGKSYEGNQAKEISVIFGNYTIIEKKQSEIQVVPREALTTSKLGEMLQKPENQFHRDGEVHVWIHSSTPFQVFQGSNEPEEARRYYCFGLEGYLWYGPYKIALPLSAEKDGKTLATLSPRQDIALNPRLRLNGTGDGFQVTIPSFICYEPQYSCKTVLFKLNDRTIENTTYVINREGFLQFQTTRVADVLENDERLKISLVTIDNEMILNRVVYQYLPKVLLFNRANRELIRPGSQEYSSNRFVLFIDRDIDTSKVKNIKVEKSSRFGKYIVYQFRWITTSEPLELTFGKEKWIFSKSADIFLELKFSHSKWNL